MKTYLVGGAVRDHLLGLPINDRDFVVVGSTVQEMLSLGFKQVGSDFPVFIFPETGEEYALSRQERKTGKGYHGFEAIFDENTTLEDDLRRRDLTINSMAMDTETGEIVDPFGGQTDLKNKILRHTSEAFREDPVRVLRLARFAAKYNFSIHYTTVDLCHEIYACGELESLTAERVFKEMEKAIQNLNFDRFLDSLFQISALNTLFPEVYNLSGIPAGPYKYHAEGSALKHTFMVIKEAAKFNNPLVTFGALCHDFGKAITPKEKLPSHPGHEEAGVPIVEHFSDRLKMPVEYKRIGVLCARHHTHVHNVFEINAKTFIRYYNDFNKGHFLHDLDILVKVAESDHFGRISVDNDPANGYPEAELFKLIMTAIHTVKISDHINVEEIKIMPVANIKDTVHRLRINAAKKVIRDYKESYNEERLGISIT